MRQTLVHIVARVGLALIVAYHALVPKLLGAHPDEIAMLRDIGLAPRVTGPVLTFLAIAEMLLALCLLFFWQRRWPPAVTLAAMVPATIGVVLSSARFDKTDPCLGPR